MRKPCCDEKHTNKGAWTEQEDQKLIGYIRSHGEGCWRTLAKQTGLHRCGKSCRLRWINYLRPDIKRGNFGQDEEDLIVKLHALLGNRWALIAGRLPGRTDSEVKNYWNSHLRRKLISMGIDPQNHRVHQTQAMHHLPPPQDDDEIVGEPQSNSHPHPHPPSGLGLKSSCSKMISVSSSKPLHSEALTMMSSVAHHHDEQVSDAGSILVDQTKISRSCELNLDLTIGFPSSSQYPWISEQSHNQESKQDMHLSKEVEADPYPTLPLYL